ncbi:MAG: TIM barrel protein [Planctomycetota bacterium]
MNDRRQFLKATGATAIGAATTCWTATQAHARSGGRKFTLDLRCGSIGVKASQAESIELAKRFGFESVSPLPHELAKLDSSQLSQLLGQMSADNIRWGAAGLPVEFRKDEARFQADLKALPGLAKALQAAGAPRVGTYIMPCHDTLTYKQNFDQHANRLRDCAKILADHGLRLGLEYVGPKTLWTSRRYPFLHSMAETKDLISEIGQTNVGFVLDSWHWYTAHETLQDLLTLTNADVVACDLNDAPLGLEIDQQIDNRRELPAATGVIDVKAFLGALVTIGYDGPVRAEPFNQPLNQMGDEAAVQATVKAMKKAFALIDVA